MAALRYDGFEVPPAGKLPDEVIADFETWIDMEAGRSPVTPTLQPVAATAQEAGFELAKAVDGDVATGWAVGGEPRKDHASVFAFDTPVGFEGGTLLTVELKVEAGQHGIVRLRRAGRRRSPMSAI